MGWIWPTGHNSSILANHLCEIPQAQGVARKCCLRGVGWAEVGMKAGCRYLGTRSPYYRGWRKRWGRLCGLAAYPSCVILFWSGTPRCLRILSLKLAFMSYRYICQWNIDSYFVEQSVSLSLELLKNVVIRYMGVYLHSYSRPRC